MGTLEVSGRPEKQDLLPPSRPEPALRPRHASAQLGVLPLRGLLLF